jgi:glycine oxidase
MLAPQIEAHEGDPLFELGLAGRERCHELSGILQAETGIDIGYSQSGIARVATTESSVADLKAKVAWQRQHGHLCDWFDEAEARNRWPWLGPNYGALWAPREGLVNPEKLVSALLADAVNHGATIVRAEATALDRAGDRVTGVVAGERFPGGDVVVAAGAWSGRIGGLPRPVSVEPIRGQMAALPWPADIPPGIFVADDCYLVARDEEALVGSTMEHEGFRTEVTSAGLARIFASVTSLAPPLAKLEVTRTWAGLRPVSPDGLPIVGKEPRSEGLWYATGHGRNGILLAGITGQIIARLLSGENEIEHLEALRPERFWNW